MKKHWSLVCLMALAAGATAQDASTKIEPSKTVIVVNGEEVKGDEYYRRMEFLPGVGRQSGNQLVEFPPGFMTIEQLITERLVFQLAKEKGILPSDSEVDSEVSIRISENPDLLKNWIASGKTAPELAYQVKYDLSSFRIQTFGITITDQEIETEYTTHPDLYTIPKQLKLHVIVVHDAASKAKADADLTAGKPFSEVATAYSDDITKARGGDYGQVPIDALSPKVRAALSDVKIGKTTEWVESRVSEDNVAYIKFQLDDVVLAQKLTLDGKLKRNIRRTLMLQRGNVKNNIQKEMATMRAKAVIDIKKPEFADAYKKYIEAYLKQNGG